MRISDWSSDVCSSDLASPHHRHGVIQVSLLGVVRQRNAVAASILLEQACLSTIHFLSRYKNEPWRPQPATPQRSAPPGGTCPNHSWFKRRPRPDCLSRSEEHTSELQSLMRISYAVFCLKTKNHTNTPYTTKLY